MENKPKRTIIEKLNIYRYNFLKKKALRILANKYYVDPKIVLKIVDSKFNGYAEEFVIRINALRDLTRRLEKGNELNLSDEFGLGTLGFEYLGRWANVITPLWRVSEPINFIDEFNELLNSLEWELEKKKLRANINTINTLITLLLFGIGVLSYYLIRPLL